jgi:hypothetical protein
MNTRIGHAYRQTENITSEEIINKVMKAGSEYPRVTDYR